MQDRKDFEFLRLIEGCNQELFQQINHIQPHGYFLAFRKPDLTICCYSENLSDIFSQVLHVGKSSLQDFLGQHVIASLNCVPPFKGGYLTPWQEVFRDRNTNRVFYGLLYQTQDPNICGLDIEGSCQLEEDTLNQKRLIHLSEVSRAIHEADSHQTLFNIFCSYFNQFFNFHRCCIYRFDEHWNGKILAEEIRDSYPAYLGTLWPETDIPRSVRQLMLVNQSRGIPDRDYQAVKIIRSPDTPILDQSLSSLRGISPAYLMFLKNLGVRATFALPIIINRTLWGLVSCHHYEKKYLNPLDRRSAEIIVRVLSERIAQLDYERNQEQRRTIEKHASTLLKKLNHSSSTLSFLKQHLAEIKKLVFCDGLLIMHQGQTFRYGQSLNESAIPNLIRFLRKKSRVKSKFVTDSIEDVLKTSIVNTGKIKGIAAFRFSADGQDWLIWLRKEVKYTNTWAGKLSKSGMEYEGRWVLEPRRSFESWHEEVKDHSLAWSDLEIAEMERFSTSLFFSFSRETQILNRQLLHQTMELKRLNEELKQFSYIASHDLKSPLCAIMGFSNILLKTENRALSQKSKHFLNRIKENALIMDQLLNTLLVYAKINYSKFDYHAIDLNEVLKAVLLQMRDEISQSQTKFQINRLPVIEGDEIQVKQLFTNLISNSLKYRSEERDLMIQIESKKMDHSWDITFADNGIGISEESRESIFQIFRRDTSRKKVGGSGLGLAICKKITELHRGQIWVEPKYQDGTKIHVILPEKSE